MSKKQKYLLVYLKTGGGHLAPARAIFNYMNRHYADVAEPRLVYGFEKTPRWVRFIIEDGYRILQYKGRWFFEFLYALNKIPIFGKLTCFSVAAYMKKYLEEVIISENPDKILIFHFFLIQPVLKILSRHKLNIEVQTVVTDPFTPHPMWFMWEKLNFIVFSRELKEKINSRFSGNTVVWFPFILDEKFSQKMNGETLADIKAKLNFNSNKKIILILGGGDGIPKGEKILRELLYAEISAQIAIVCGKNEILQKGAEKLKKKYEAKNLKVYGYVDFIYELINISDVIITKCGASTIMEILNLKKVPVVNDYIWEQEQGNVDYLIEKRLGIYEPDIKKLPDAVKNLLEDEKLYSVFKKNIENEKIRNGIREVTEYILK